MDTIANGGIIIPQLGESAGSSLMLPTVLAKPLTPHLSALVNKIEASAWETILAGSQNIPITDSGLSCPLVAIRPSFGPAIGGFWSLVNEQRRQAVSVALKGTEQLVVLGMNLAKLRHAFNVLSNISCVEIPLDDASYKNLAYACRDALCCKDIILWRMDPRTSKLDTIASTANVLVDLPIGKGIAGVCATDSKPIVINDLLNKEEVIEINPTGVSHPTVIANKGWRAALYLPLDAGAEIIGVLGALASRPSAFTKIDREIADAFAKRICSAFIHSNATKTSEILKSRIEESAITIEAGKLTIERIHDARNSLNLAQNELSLLQMELAEKRYEKAKTYAANASDYIRSAQKLTKKIANITRVLKDRKPILKRHDLYELLKEIVSNRRAEAEEARVAINNHCAQGLIVDMDWDQMDRVFSNLLSNAIYFLKHDVKGQRKAIEIFGEAVDNVVRIRVRDNGPGIPKEDLSKIFDYYFTTKGQQGMGLGLGIARRIILQHGGNIAVTSRWGYLTEFEITMPRPPVDERQAHRDSKRVQITMKKEKENETSSGIHTDFAESSMD